jgi:hypothetical protein
MIDGDRGAKSVAKCREDATARGTPIVRDAC